MAQAAIARLELSLVCGNNFVWHRERRVARLFNSINGIRIEFEPPIDWLTQMLRRVRFLFQCVLNE